MSIPKIETAIPKRRYQIGTFSAVILGDIESEDDVRYRYICALVPEGVNEPVLYIAHIRQSGGDIVRIASADGTQDLVAPDSMQDLDSFCDQALPVAQKLLSLTDEMPARLM